MRKVNSMIIAPSILSLDFTKFNESIKALNTSARWLHFDVMDGNFVDNISFGPGILNDFRKSSELFMDVHLMINNPEKYYETFIKAGADNITFHIESLDYDVSRVLDLIQKIKDKYVRVGVSLKPNTSVEKIEPILPYVDIVLVMSVEPGFGGQKFIDSTYDRISYLNSYRKINDLGYLIEVDGGVDDTNAAKLSSIGTNILVSGSYIFKDDIKFAIDKLKYITKA